MSMSKADILADCLQSGQGTIAERSAWIRELWQLHEDRERERDEARRVAKRWLGAYQMEFGIEAAETSLPWEADA